MKEITTQQQRVLDCIQIYINKTGFPPTRANICKELGFKSPNSAETHLRALEKKGFISIESGASRGISIINNEQSDPSDGNNYPVIGLVAAGSPTLASENIENKILSKNNPISKIVDIGGGYCQFGEMIKRKFGNIKVTTVDFYEQLILGYFYLLENFPNKKICPMSKIIFKRCIIWIISIAKNHFIITSSKRIFKKSSWF